jgi:transcriptional regulator GlxA family with amidase domain
MLIAFSLYPAFTSLDVIGAYQVFANWPDTELTLVGPTKDPILDDRGVVALSPTATFSEVVSPDVIVVPGSSRPFESLEDRPLLDWLVKVEPTARWVTSVCTGSGLLAAAGLLGGRRAATHWAYRGVAASAGIDVAHDRYVIDGKFATGGGVTAGIDMALALTAREFDDTTAKMIQLFLEYDPSPPFPGGTIVTSEPAILDAVLRSMEADVPAGTRT